MILGAHRSTAGGAWRAAESGKQIGCDAIQIFTRAPSRWEGKPISDEEAEHFKQACAELNLKAVAHDIYLTNLASPKEELRNKSIVSMKDEIARCHQLGAPYLVTHCGSHDGSGEAAGIRRVGEALRECLDSSEADGVCVLLEATAGQGDCLGWRFEHLADMLAQTDRPLLTGVCLDTCHMFAAGYDLRSAEAFAHTFEEFDRTVGLKRLKAMHANDCKKDIGSRVDRHDNIGKGFLGAEAFRLLVNDSRFQDIPILLETPDLEKHEEDLKFLRSLIGKTSV